MQRFITDKRTGIQYELIGDYYYPCLTVENEEPPMLTKYGRMRERYLREHKRVLYFNLLTSGKLYEHLAEIDTSACNMAKYLIKEMARKQGVTEQLKAEDMMKWVGLMNNIGACVDEIVLNDIVYMELNLDGKGQPQPEQAITKSTRPSVLDRLKVPHVHGAPKKPHKKEMEAR